jgi:hypothetical protein
VEPGSAVVDEGGLAVAWQEFAVRTAKSSGKIRRLALSNTGCTIPGGTTGVLGVMVEPYHSEHRWGWVGAVYASDVCQFRGI